MGFFDKIKQFLGFAGLKVKLEAPDTFGITEGMKDFDGVIEGKVTITASKDQTIEIVEVDFTEQWSKGTGSDTKYKTFPMGKVEFPGFDIKAGESKTIDFKLPYNYTKSANDNLGKVLGGVGKFMSGERSTFYLTGSAKPKGSVFPSTDNKRLTRV